MHMLAPLPFPAHWAKDSTKCVHMQHKKNTKKVLTRLVKCVYTNNMVCEGGEL
jgi:hypothetical protein